MTAFVAKRPAPSLGVARVSDRCQAGGCKNEAIYRIRDVDRAVPAVRYVCVRHADESGAK